MSKTKLTNEVPEGTDHRELKENGQQRAYVVLSDEERSKGFVRPYRDSYVHVGEDAIWSDKGSILLKYGPGGCGTLTKMSREIAETYARNPYFYSGTFCVGCRAHFPLEQFVWDGTREIVGT